MSIELDGLDPSVLDHFHGPGFDVRQQILQIWKNAAQFRKLGQDAVADERVHGA
jgi:hypothetical protein